MKNKVGNVVPQIKNHKAEIKPSPSKFVADTPLQEKKRDLKAQVKEPIRSNLRSNTANASKEIDLGRDKFEMTVINMIQQINDKVTKISNWVDSVKATESTKSQTASDASQSGRKTKLSKKSSRGCSVKSKAKVLEQLSQNLEEMNKQVERISLQVTETKASIDTEQVVVEPGVPEQAAQNNSGMSVAQVMDIDMTEEPKEDEQKPTEEAK